ncbi:MAG TPA: hypothetical protein VN033_02010 [Vulgatibacter sp.]|nr:hypothetical protein [Vulgatibacter sp.]
MHLRTTCALIAGVLALASCEAQRPEPIGEPGTGGTGGGAGGAGGGSPWTFSTVDAEADTGHQAELRVAPGGGLAAAWYRNTGRQGICQLPDREPAPTDVWEVVYGEERDGAFATEVVAEVELVGRPTGLSLAFDGSGAPMVAYMGGQPAQYRCGGTDSILSTRGGGSWTHATIDADGAVPAMIFDEDVAFCADYQDACNRGDVVGLWPALGMADGSPLLAYRDIHFGFGVDAEEKADLQLWWNGSLVTAEATSGGGQFTRLAVDGAGGVHIAHYNQHKLSSAIPNVSTEGIWMLHFEGGAWSREKVVPTTPVGETLALAASGAIVGLAWHEPQAGVVRYAERSGDGWAAPQVVDNRGRTGLSPSLAFDADGNPALAYRRCGPAGQSGADCTAADDALRFAVRTGDGWKAVTVRSDEGRQEGLSTSLVFDPEGRPAILFQESYFDAQEGTVLRRLVLARGELP